MTNGIGTTEDLSSEETAERQFLLNAAFIANVFDMNESRVRSLMERKLFRSRVERGLDEDAGSWRLTLRCGNRAWQGVVDERGIILHQTVGLVPSRQVHGQ